MSSTAIERSLRNIRSELEFLRDEKFITPDQYQEVASVLSTLPSQSNNQSRPAASAPAQSSDKVVYAMYDWNGHEASDMSLHKGDRIEVTEQINNDWWRGKANGNEGVFPANFVSDSPQFQQNKSNEYIAAPSQYDEKQNYAPPPNYYGSQASLQQQPQQGQYYGAPQQQYYQPQQQVQQGQPPFVQEQQQQQQPQASHHNGQLKKFGSKFGNAAIWGAGATLGSDLINSIF